MIARTLTIPKPCRICGSLVAGLHALYCPDYRGSAKFRFVVDVLPFGGSEVR